MSFLKGIFGGSKTEFQSFMSAWFGPSTATKIEKVFEDIGLPLPENHKEFLAGSEGALVFLNKYGLVLRIERADKALTRNTRINDNDHILSPIASIDVGSAVIEICPGTHQTADRKVAEQLVDALKQDNIKFWDKSISNIGRLPIKTAEFPEGVPVVIDRLGVKKLKEETDLVRDALTEQRSKNSVQGKFYAPLRNSFNAAWNTRTKRTAPDQVKMEKFLKLCEKSLKEGKLVTGWNTVANDPKFDHSLLSKSIGAAKAAAQYDVRFK